VRVRFGEFVFDSGTRELSRSGEAQPLSPKAFELLGVLLECRPEAQSRKQLHERLWSDTFVSQASLTLLVSELRKALGDDEALPASPSISPAGCWLVWGDQEIALCEGEHLLGRDPDVLVRISSPKVSRHHARIVVRDGRAVLEDLGSKNGTYLGGSRIEEPSELVDRSEIWIGSEVLTFRAVPATLTTETATRR